MKSNKTLPPICEGQMVSHAHTEDAREYRLYDSEGNKDLTANLCSRCVKQELEADWDWRLVDKGTDQ
jgi:hypothetical protein